MIVVVARTPPAGIYDLWMDQCLALNPEDVAKLCVHLSERIDGLKTQPLVTALIAAAAAALTAFLSTSGSLFNSKTERNRKSQREALYGAQDAAQALRTGLTGLKAWSDAGEGGENPLPTHKEQDLVAALEKQITRISDSSVQEQFKSWKDWARLYFTGSDQHDMRSERELWNRAIDGAGVAARKLD